MPDPYDNKSQNALTDEETKSLSDLSKKDFALKIRSKDKAMMKVMADKELTRKLFDGEFNAAVEPTKDPEKTPEPEKKDPPPETKPETKTPENQEGTSSESGKEKQEDLLANAQNFIGEQKSRIDKANEEKGKMGQDIKALEAEKLAMEKEMEKLKVSADSKKETAPAKGPEALPPYPEPDANLDEDIYSDSYQKKVKEYNQKKDTYIARLVEGGNQTQKELGEIKSFMEETKNANTVAAEQAAQTAYAQNLTSIFTEAGDLQKNNPELKTSIPFKKIDDLIQSAGTIEKLRAAKLVPEADLAIHDKIMGAVKTYRGVDKNGHIIIEGTPVLESLNEAYVLHKIRNGETINAPPTDNEKIIQAQKAAQKKTLEQMQKLEDAPAELPNNAVGNPDDNLSEAGGESSAKRMIKLMKQMKKSPVAFKQTEQFKELQALNAKFDLKTPDPKPVPI